MIVLESEVRAALGLMPAITDTQQARLMLAVMSGHAAIRKYLHYDPEQRAGNAEYYPRADSLINVDHIGEWDVNTNHTRATFTNTRGIFKNLQLARLPIRSVSEVRVDYSAYFGQQNGDFGSGTEWEQGVDYAVEWDEEGVCRSGCLVAISTGWPVNPGTVKVTYRAGYSPLEFAGQATANETDVNGNVTKIGVDASPIKAATLMTCMAQYHQLHNWSQNQLTGLLTPGPKSSESLGSYSYSLANGAAAAMITGMQLEVPPAASMLLEPFMHYGLMALG